MVREWRSFGALLDCACNLSLLVLAEAIRGRFIKTTLPLVKEPTLNNSYHMGRLRRSTDLP